MANGNNVYPGNNSFDISFFSFTKCIRSLSFGPSRLTFREYIKDLKKKIIYMNDFRFSEIVNRETLSGQVKNEKRGL